MAPGIKIAPSILAADFARIGAEVRAAEAAGADFIHVDVMDGRFVPNLTIGPVVAKALRPHVSGVLDAHLMIQPADPFIPDFAKAGADIITVHAEAGPHLDRSLQLIRAQGCKAGVSLNPSTPEHVLDYVLDQIDLILVMTVNPGFSGQSFLASQLDKIRAIRHKIGDRPIDLQVDGGINDQTIADAARAGANVFVAGTAVFGKSDYGDAIRRLREAAEQAFGTFETVDLSGDSLELSGADSLTIKPTPD